MYDTVIIGAGMSGLAAGIRLAYYDRPVCIVERHTAIGGLNSFYRLNGRTHDVGLHAVTNYAAKGGRRGPLAKLLRQLRLDWEDFNLAPQRGSAIVFPGVTLRFGNDPDLLRSEIRRAFPAQTGNFERLLDELADYDQLGSPSTCRSARQAAGRLLDDPLLVEMLFCPVMCYGGARERDMDFGQFSVLFRSIFLEGLGRPADGIRTILAALGRKFRGLGGELRLGTGVRRIGISSGSADRVILEDGTELPARRILSCAGWRETLRLCGVPPDDPAPGLQGISMVESISVLGVQPQALGIDRTAVFFNDSAEFHYARPDDLVDLHLGVVCSPNNFSYDQPLAEGIVRVTALANYDRWAALDPDAYRLAKRRSYDHLAASAVRFVPDFRSAVIDTDLFTPVTIRRFTGHDGGAVYGAPEKRYDGRTHLANLFLCGADQGLVGIVGAMLSGIAIANRYLLGPE